MYPEYCPCIGWPQFREVYKQTLMEDKSLLDHAESFYQMRQEQWVVEEALKHQQRRPQEWGPSPLTAECDDLPIPTFFPLHFLLSPVLNMTLNCINYALCFMTTTDMWNEALVKIPWYRYNS